jgi:hypothetical protein
VPSTRRREREARAATAPVPPRMLGSYGPTPKGLFGEIPVAELAILIGLIGAIVGILGGGGPALIVGIIVCALGVFEVTVREHFSGYRSHTTLLAAAPAVLLEVAVAEIFGVPRQRILVLAPAIPVFVICFLIFRRAFQAARQTRVARYPS